MKENTDKKIRKQIQILRGWIFLKHLCHVLLWSVPAGVFLAAVFEGISCLIPWMQVHQAAVFVILASFFCGTGFALFHYPSAKKAALLLDATGLMERTVTALELIGDDSLFASLQKEDALKQMMQVPFHRRLPFGISWKRPCVLLLCLLLFTGLTFLPSPAKLEAKTYAEVVKEAKEEVKKLEKEEKKAAEAKLSELEKQELKELLSQMKKEMLEAKSSAALEKAKERGIKKLEQLAEKTNNRELSKSLNQMRAGLNQKDEALAKKREEQQKAAQEAMQNLEKLVENPENVSKEQLEQTAQALQNLAQLADSKAQADALTQSASELQSGQLSADDLAQTLAQTQAMAQQDSGQLAQTQNSQTAGQNVGQSGQNGQAGQTAGQNVGQSGQNGQAGQTAGQNVGQSGQNGQAGQSAGQSGQNGQAGQTGNGNGAGWNYGSNQGTERPGSYQGEMVSVPNEIGNDGNLTGIRGEGGSYQVQGGDALTWRGNSVSYEQVLGDYSQKAMSEIEASDYPAGVQKFVKSYFEELNQ